MTQAAILAASGSPGTTTGFKNKLVNGAMSIAQRATGATNNSASGSTLTYNTLDRWGYWSQSANVFSTQQSTTAPPGFSYSTLITSLTAYNASTGGYATWSQRVEGFNAADLAWGTVNAKTVTFSFWIRSSITGTFGGYIFDSLYSYNYPFPFTINAANTWEQKTITITGPTSGTWSTTNGIGLEIGFTLAAGTAYFGTPNTWTSSAFILGSTGSSNMLATNGATWYITGCQLEVGTTATNFDFRSIGTEDFLCKRYYQSFVGNELYLTAYDSNTSTRVAGNMSLPVTMRTAPTMSYTTNALGSLVAGNVLNNWVSYIYNGASGRTGNTELISLTASAEL